jgi:hypothetical protein
MGLPRRLAGGPWKGAEGPWKEGGSAAEGAPSGEVSELILDLFRQGYGFSGVVKELAGQAGGRRYSEARKAVEAVLLERALGLGAAEEDDDVLLLEVVGRDDEDDVDAAGEAPDDRRAP